MVANDTGLYVSRHLNECLDEFKPDLIVYIAGTAVLCNDESGGLCLTPQVSSFYTYTCSILCPAKALPLAVSAVNVDVNNCFC